jgi:hypothetical protein
MNTVDRVKAILGDSAAEALDVDLCSDHDDGVDLQQMYGRPWLGVDLDGCLAHYDGWRGRDVIGAPVPELVRAVKNTLATGLRVKIFTARVHPADPHWRVCREAIVRWCEQHLGEKLEVTHEKDPMMIELWDDRCKRIEQNTGRFLHEAPPALARRQPTVLHAQVDGTHHSCKRLQPVLYCEANGLGYNESAVVGYVTRHKEKNGERDLTKAIHHLLMHVEIAYPQQLENVLWQVKQLVDGALGLENQRGGRVIEHQPV